MPELPEVETVVRDLRPRLIGRRLAAVKASVLPLRRRWEAAWGKKLIGRTVREICRRGKWIVIALDDETHLVVHLGMTGQLTVVPAAQERHDHTHLVFRLDAGEDELRYRDVRRFGSATWFADADAVERFFAAGGLGPEPFNLDAAYWRYRLAGANRCLKAVLLDQRVVAGVGNIYADEALFEARLHPARLACDVTTPEANRLRQAVAGVLERAIGKRGSSVRNYVDGTGRQGSYQNEFRVYRRTGQPCPRCGVPIARVRLAGRSTHYCPQCQSV